MRAILSFTILLLLLYGSQASPSTDSDVSSEIDVFDYMDVNNSAFDKSLKCINWGTGIPGIPGIPSVPSPADIPTEPIRNQPSKLRQRSSRQRNNAIRKSTIAPKTASSSVPSGSMPVESIS